MYHAGVAGKLGCLKLKKCGLLCMLMNFATIYTLAECTSDLVVNKREKTCSGIIVHHAGVAVKVISYLVKFQMIPLYNFEMFVAECKMISLESFEGLSIEMRCSVRQVVHY